MKFVTDNRKLLAMRVLKPLTPRQNAQLIRLADLEGSDTAMRYLMSFSGQSTHVNRSYLRLYTPPREAPVNNRREVLKKLRDKNLQHYPWLDNERFIGVELELCIPKANYSKLKELATFGVTLRGDGSLRTNREIEGLDDGPNDDTTLELNILMKQGNYEQLKKVLDFLNTNGAYVNRSCGVHVHIDQRHNDKKTAMQVFSRLQNAVAPLLSKLVKQARLTPNGTNYCATTRNAKNKYQAVNFLPYKSRRTIEVRMHHGSLDYSELVTWIETLLMVSEAKGMVRPKKQKTWEETLNIMPHDRRLVLQEIARRRSEEATQGHGLALVRE